MNFIQPQYGGGKRKRAPLPVSRSAILPPDYSARDYDNEIRKEPEPIEPTPEPIQAKQIHKETVKRKPRKRVTRQVAKHVYKKIGSEIYQDRPEVSPVSPPREFDELETFTETTPVDVLPPDDNGFVCIKFRR